MNLFGYDCDEKITQKNIKEDLINHPSHYNQGIEVTEYIESWDMSFVEGNIIKYVTRYKYKNGKEDLLKAQWYLNRLIESYEKQIKQS